MYSLTYMQAATATTPPGTASDPPRAGDGFTFEHLADRSQLWLDFCADTGDGGNPTYAVARAMAAPGLKVCLMYHNSHVFVSMETIVTTWEMCLAWGMGCIAIRSSLLVLSLAASYLRLQYEGNHSLLVDAARTHSFAAVLAVIAVNRAWLAAVRHCCTGPSCVHFLTGWFPLSAFACTLCSPQHWPKYEVHQGTW